LVEEVVCADSKVKKDVERSKRVWRGIKSYQACQDSSLKAKVVLRNWAGGGEKIFGQSNEKSGGTGGNFFR